MRTSAPKDCWPARGPHGRRAPGVRACGTTRPPDTRTRHHDRAPRVDSPAPPGQPPLAPRPSNGNAHHARPQPDPRPHPPQPPLVRQPCQPGNDRALPRALHELRPHAGRAAIGQAHHRHRPDRQRPLALQPPPGRPREAGCGDGNPGTWAACRSSSPSIPSRRAASAPPRRSTATSPTSAWSRCCTAYPIDGVVLTAGCDKTVPAVLMGAGHRQHPRHPALGRPHARWLVQRPPRRVRHGRVGGAEAACRGEDPVRRVHRHGRRLRRVGRALQHHGHGAQHEQPRRGPRHVAARLRRHPRAAQGAGPG